MIGARLHKTIAEIALEICSQARSQTKLNEVALSGDYVAKPDTAEFVRNGLKKEGLSCTLTDRSRPMMGDWRWVKWQLQIILTECKDNCSLIATAGNHLSNNARNISTLNKSSAASFRRSFLLFYCLYCCRFSHVDVHFLVFFLHQRVIDNFFKYFTPSEKAVSP